ncbi:hypothetical protein GTW51_10085 [Aurantimonas aggregata]|uniref:Uncharacterized protein n=1 Tax=Aurantimonas aggregata TaxID=2047720 RepID=A0A6L9MHV2_9HYPH|nr:hypothetical protein [Aurantimonas aggregata]NDV87050.1 hypothetical protein [Aurantimonas aggregata]
MAHTPPDQDPERGAAAPIEDGNPAGIRATVDQAAADLAAQLEGADDGDDADLFGVSLFAGPVSYVADTIEGAKGRGRPKGASNKRTTAMRNYLLAKGYRHPMENLAAIASANPMDLAAELSTPYRAKSGPREGELVEESCTPAEALAMILKANAELLPYFESKRPVEIDVTERRLGVLLVGDLAAGGAAGDAFMSVTGQVRQAQRNQGDSDGET